MTTTPSIMSWLRLEPLPRQASMVRGTRAAIYDPAWILARQCMMGEFEGVDGGSPVQGTLTVLSQALTGYQAGTAGPSAFDSSVPLEAHVERETVTLGVRQAVQLGQHFEVLARQAKASDNDIALYRGAFPVTSAPLSPPSRIDKAEDAASRAFRAAVAGRAVDGVQLRTAIRNKQALPQTSVDLTAVATSFLQFCSSLYSEPSQDAAWNAQQLLFQCSLGADPGPNPANLTAHSLTAPDYRGGELDWYSFDPAAIAVTSPAPKAPASTTVNFLPARVTFRGGPHKSWFHFENAQTDFSAFETEHVDIAKLLVAEFCLIYGNDWFHLPVPVSVGTLSSIDALVITDTFGYRALIQPADQSGTGGGPAWSMFQLSDGTTRLPYLFVPPTLGTVIEAPPVEEVVFARDEMAEMAWGIEQQILGPLSTAVDGHEAWRLKVGSNPAAPPPTAPGADIYYVLQTTVPDYWIPFVPVQEAQQPRTFVRAQMPPVGSTEGPRTALLNPGARYVVNDQAIPANGLDVTRYFRRARWLDGSTTLWMARRSRPGPGPGTSGLAYDLVVPAGKLPSDVLA
jgi:hypothetical protein